MVQEFILFFRTNVHIFERDLPSTHTLSGFVKPGRGDILNMGSSLLLRAPIKTGRK